MNFEEKVEGTIFFIRCVSEPILAKLIMHQNNTIKGLARNNLIIINRSIGEEMDGNFEEKVQGTMLFIRSISERKLAEFIVHQNNAIEGLAKNHELFIEGFHKMHINKPPSPST